MMYHAIILGQVGGVMMYLVISPGQVGACYDGPAHWLLGKVEGCYNEPGLWLRSLKCS